MKAHELDGNGLILNTIVVDSLDFLPNLVDASIGGSIGDSIIDGGLVKVVPVVPVPASVTMRQARLALLGAGLLDDVGAAIDSLQEPTKTAARIEWDYSSEVHRNRGLVLELSAALGLTEAQLDQLFITASKIL